MAVLVRALPSRPLPLAADAPFSRSQPYVETELGPGTVQLLRDIKRQMDPQNILVRPPPPLALAQEPRLTLLGTLQNPGKLIPDEKGEEKRMAH